MNVQKKTSRLIRLFHKPVAHSGRKSAARYLLLKSFLLLAKTVARLLPGKKNKLTWQELTYKIRAFIFFEHTNIILDIDEQSRLPLEVEIEKIRILEPWNRVWALEGVGYIYAENRLKHKENSAAVLCNGKLPAWSLGSLHSGMGMAFAGCFLHHFTDHKTSHQSPRSLEQYITLVRENSQPGCAEIMLDSLGFIARLMYPQKVRELNSDILKIERDFTPYFWHGVGRALFFLPEHIRPRRSFPGKAVKTAAREAPDEPAFQNMLSGLAWPLTLVNLREPRIFEQVLTRHRDCLTGNAAFFAGVCSAIVFWAGSIADMTLVDSFLDFTPSPQLRETWDTFIKIPCREALNDWYPRLAKRKTWAELFKYRQNSPV